MSVETAPLLRANQVKGPPILQNFIRNPAAYKHDRVGLFQRVFAECGDLGMFTVGRRKYYLASSVELAHELLVKNGMLMDKPERFRIAMRPLLGDGLLAALNELHARQRKLIQPQFRKKTLLATSARVAADHAHRAAAMWPDGGTVEVYREMMRLVMLIVATDVFGRNVHADADDFGSALNAAIAEFNVGVSALAQIFTVLPSPSRRRYLAAIEKMDQTFYRMLAEHRTDPDPPDDWVTALLECRYEDGTPMADRQIRDEAINLLMAGNETTGSALTWTFYLLTQHPDVYARLLAEVDDALEGRQVTLADLPRLPYTLQVFKESMRVYPPVYMFSRQPTQDIVACGYKIPAGSAVLFSPYIIHHRADYFPDPERFDPDRFAPERERDIPSHAYMPFASGHRICIGNNHALLNGHIVVASISQQVVFEAIPGTRVSTDPKLTLRPRNGIPMRVRHRSALT